MSIERDYDGFAYGGENGMLDFESTGFIYRPVCDLCGDDLCETDTFESAVENKKRHGWASWKDDNGAWFDVCPDCQKKYAKKFHRATAASDFEGVGLN